MSTVHVLTNMDSALPVRASAVERRLLRLSTLARRRGLDRRQVPLICQRNGRYVRQRDWHRTLAGKNDVVIFTVMPAGNGVGRTIASIAILIVAAIVAPYIAAPLAVGLGITGAAATALTLATTAALAFGGNLLVNALIPLPRPNLPGLATSLAANESEAPTYAFTVSSQQNLPRLGAPIPAWYGYHRVVPDLAATAWWEWIDGQQKLFQTLCLTQGYVDVEKIELGRVPISTFEEISTELVDPGDSVTLFEPEVFQSPDVRGIALNAPNDLLSGDDGVYGPFAVTPPGVETDRFGIDISFPRGLYSTSGASILFKSVMWRVEIQRINDAGVAMSGWSVVADETFNSSFGMSNVSVGGTFKGGGYASAAKATSPLTVSYRYTTASSRRWQVRLTRLDNKDLSGFAGHDIAWTGLRGFLGGGAYGDVTVLAMVVTATASVNDQTVRQIAVTGTRKLPVWDPDTETWSAPVATRSIAWAVADMIRNATYGGARNDSEYDLDQLVALDAIWTARGDTFDYFAAAPRTLWEMLGTALRAGRATRYRQAGMVRFHRDSPQTLPRQLFSRENIVKGTFTTRYVLPAPDDDTDGIELRYFDRGVWNFATLRARFDGPGVPDSAFSMTLDGVIEADQAQRELDYMIAERNLRTILPAFTTEMEGNLPSYGDLVLIQHDTPRWGTSNRVIAWDVDTLTATLFRAPIREGAGTWFARFRDVRGRPSAAVEIAAFPSATTITLAEPPTYDDATAFDFTLSSSELMHVTLGLAEDAPRLAIFKKAVPRKGRQVSIELAIENDGVHVN